MKTRLLAMVLGLLALALIVPAAHAAGTGTLTGHVVRWNGAPVAGATVAALLGPLETDKEVTHTTTAADGSWSLTVPTGTPVFVHIRTLGTWWGYSYKPSFTLRDGETISQVYFAVGPRDVHEITLPAPVSNQPPAPVVVPTAPPISNVKPIIGTNPPESVPAKPITPVHSVPQAPRPLPATGAPAPMVPPLALLLVALALLPLAGLALRRAAAHNA